MRVLLMYSLGPPSPQHLQRLQDLSPRLQLCVVEHEDQAVEMAEGAEVILGHRYLRQCISRARRLRWVQSSAGSVDRLPIRELRARGIILTRWIQDAPVVAAHAIALAWSLTRALPGAYRNQMEERWDQQLEFPPMPKKALVMGQGAVGQAISACLHAQGIAVVCGKRGPGKPSAGSPCERFLPIGQWYSELPDCDWCFLALPNTSETAGMFDEAALRALPPHAVLVNVGRGENLDTVALSRVLKEGHLAGAGLDVVQPEPLPPGHPLWRTPRVLITPHVAAHHTGRLERIERFFEDQMRAFIAQRPLSAMVDLQSVSASVNSELSY